MRLGSIYVGTLDVMGGAFTYGNRIAIEQLFTNTQKSEYQLLKEAHRELYGYSCLLLPRKMRFKRLTAIAEGLAQWCRIEAQELDYKPTAEELAAGIDEYRKKVGHLATIEAIAEKFGQDPDDVLKWAYSKVFGFLRKDLLESKFQQRYNDIMTRKNGGNKKHN